MGLGDKIQNKAQEVAGKTKEAKGKSTHDASLQVEGVKDQAAAHTKQAGEKAKDAVKGITGNH